MNPDVNFGTGEMIAATVSVDDLAIPAHSLVMSPWVFTTTPAGAATLTLHPSGLSENTGAFSSLGALWSRSADTNDGNATYIHRCCGPPTYYCYVDMDDVLA